MQEAKHTPGPWRALPYKNQLKEVGISSPIGTIAAVITSDMPHGEAEGDANARLIAAAPDLLTALQAVLEDMSSNALQDRVFAIACEAIAKATGTQEEA